MPPWRLPTMSSSIDFYVRLIREVQPIGPVSIGGLVCFRLDCLWRGAAAGKNGTARLNC